MKVVNYTYRHFPSPDLGMIDILIVLTIGQVGDYAAYAGAIRFEEKEKVTNIRWVADNGLKLSHAECVRYFPTVPANRYRA